MIAEESERELTEIIIKHDLNSQKIPFISKNDYIDLKERKQSNKLQIFYLIFYNRKT